MARSESPSTKFRFKVEIDGIVVAHFQGVSGISSETEVVTHVEGGRTDREVKLPGQNTLGSITLKRGYSLDHSLQAWFDQVAALGTSSAAVRRTLGVVVKAFDGTADIGRYTIERAFPSKWTLEELVSQSAEGIETLELVHEGLSFQRARPGSPLANAQQALAAALNRQAEAAAAEARGRARAAQNAASAAASAEAAMRARADGSFAANLEIDADAGVAAGTAAASARAAAAVRGQASAMAEGWAGAAAASVAADVDVNAEVSAAFEDGRPVVAASVDAQASVEAQAEVALGPRGFARGGASAAAGARASAEWSDGVDARQTAAGFAEGGLVARLG